MPTERTVYETIERGGAAFLTSLKAQEAQILRNARAYDTLATSMARATGARVNGRPVNLNGGGGGFGGGVGVGIYAAQARELTTLRTELGRVDNNQRVFVRNTAASSRELRNATRDTDRLARSLRGLAGASAVAGGGRALGSLGLLGPTGVALGGVGVLGFGEDSYLRLERAASLYGGTQERVNRRISDTRRLAQSTFQSLGDVTKQYQRLAAVAGELGATDPQVQSILTSLGNAERIAGGRSPGTISANQQFIQALSSGLQGDEARAIVEGNPVLARSIAEGLSQVFGETIRVGDLRRSQGRLSGRDTANAILLAGVNLSRQASGLTPLPSEELRRFGNTLISANQELGRLTGVGTFVGGGLRGLSDGVAQVTASIIFAAQEIRALIPGGSEGVSLGSDFQLGAQVVTDGIRTVRDTAVDAISVVAATAEASIRTGSLDPMRKSSQSVLREIDIAQQASVAQGGRETYDQILSRIRGGTDGPAQDPGLIAPDPFTFRGVQLVGGRGLREFLEELDTGTARLNEFTTNVDLGGTRFAQETDRYSQFLEELRRANGGSLPPRNTPTGFHTAVDAAFADRESAIQSRNDSLFAFDVGERLAEGQRLLELQGQLIGATERERAAAEAMFSLQAEARAAGVTLLDEQRQAYGKLAAERQQLLEVEQTSLEMGRIGADFTRDLALGFGSAEEAAGRLLGRLGELILELTVFQPLAQTIAGSSFVGAISTALVGAQNGGVFVPGGTQLMADGGITRQPTYFPSLNVVTSEYGQAEAVLPLSESDIGRGPDGKAGVKASAMGGGVQPVGYVSTEAFKRGISEAEVMDIITEQVSRSGSRLNQAVRATR
ncbi:MAG: tape measure protein [Planctomycetota bacterium]